MRRDVIFSAAKNVVSALEESEIRRAITSCRRRAKEGANSSTEILSSFSKYSLLASHYGEAEKELCHIMGISDLDDPSLWDKFLNISSGEEERTLMTRSTSIAFAVEHLPKLMELIKQDYVEELKLGDAQVPDNFKNKELLSVVVIEEEGSFSSPQRLSNILNCIDTFYSAVAAINEADSNDLMVLAVDSGSDKSFDFLGLEKLVKGVKEIIVTIWDKKVYHRHNQSGADLELIAKSLPVIEEIKRLKEEGALDHETAGKLVNDTVKAATKFIESGATIPEINAQASHDPRKLMKPSQKLLIAPSEVHEYLL